MPNARQQPHDSYRRAETPREAVRLRSLAAIITTAAPLCARVDPRCVLIIPLAYSSAPEDRALHWRDAVRLRGLAVTITTEAVRARVLAQALEHARLIGLTSGEEP